MVEIKAFRGLFFNKKKVKDLKLVLTPPYDVISEEEKKEFMASSPFNMAHLLLGEDKEGDNETNNKCTRAADKLKAWISDSVLTQDNEDSVYIYAQEYLLKKYQKEPVKKIRKGFIALAKIEGYDKKVILPHEKTLSKPKQGRLNLMRATHTNLGQIFVLYHDKNRVMTKIIEAEIKREPDVEFTDTKGIKHSLWRISNKPEIEGISKEMADKRGYIADGHHRYETALNFTKEHPELESAKYRMMTFVNVDDEGLLALPTHRLVRNLDNFDIEKLENDLLHDFDVEVYEFEDGEEELQRNKMLDRMKGRFKKHVFGMLCKGVDKYFLLSLKDDKIIDSFAKDKPLVWKKLDVAILHSLILDKLLGIDEEALSSQKYVDYVKGDPELAVKLMKEKDYQFTFFLNPTKIQEVLDVADAGATMPQKSTFFYPKLISGLVMYKFD